jgi:hypothetical protein
MLAMSTPSASASRLILVPDDRIAAAPGPHAAKLRRYRLARLRLLERREAGPSCAPHLIRVYD